MVDVHASNDKLRARARRAVALPRPAGAGARRRRRDHGGRRRHRRSPLPSSLLAASVLRIPRRARARLDGRRAGGTSGRRSGMSWVERELREQPAGARSLPGGSGTRRCAGARASGARDERDVLLPADRIAGQLRKRCAVRPIPVRSVQPAAGRVLDAVAVHALRCAAEARRRALAIAISQSGESQDVVSVLAEAKRQGRPTVAITNEAASPLTRHADWVLPLPRRRRARRRRHEDVSELGCGGRAAVGGGLQATTRASRRSTRCPNAVEAQVERSLDASPERSTATPAQNGGVVVARGLNLATAFEIALKIRELSGIPFEPFSSAGPPARADRRPPPRSARARGRERRADPRASESRSESCASGGRVGRRDQRRRAACCTPPTSAHFPSHERCRSG